ncbi:thiamine phosphate synthase [Parabacteroides bouchesdurhonensis]|uniref:thiamine phosphate synthase n=1 Tax=Parabacteroides bouchesdurhonensis TaxID=1936995 RepID=UPI000E53F2C2|nr:thiamine phosphate synthase [Parabacteroides bouchesdurhonensis]RHJ91376.1 thiamine phosphate synthase [Bacteroides sp. AM07-16]
MKKLIVITTPDFFPGEGEILTNLFVEGMNRLHLRKPDCRQEDMEMLLKEIPAAFYPRIVLHDCFGIVDNGNPLNIGGVHLNKRNNIVPDGFKGSISRSCHNMQEIAEGNRFDYQFLSPVFESISKEGYGKGFSADELRKASNAGLINDKVIALGGISTTTIPQLKDIKFGGIAVLGALWGKTPSINEQNNIIRQFKLLRSCV